MRLGPDGEPMSKEGYVLKRMLLEKGKHVMQAGIRSGLVVEPSRHLAKRERGRCHEALWVLGLVVVLVGGFGFGFETLQGARRATGIAPLSIVYLDV